LADSVIEPGEFEAVGNELVVVGDWETVVGDWATGEGGVVEEDWIEELLPWDLDKFPQLPRLTIINPIIGVVKVLFIRFIMVAIDVLFIVSCRYFT
jgi:hypothetical protein